MAEGLRLAETPMPRSGDAVVGQEQPSGTEVQAEGRGNRPAHAGPTESM